MLTRSTTGEDAYTAGFTQWEAGQYDAGDHVAEGFHRRLSQASPRSYANNLIGRALLDKGERAGRGRRVARQLSQQPRGASARPTASFISARR